MTTTTNNDNNHLLVTVGSTSFPALTNYLSNAKIYQTLMSTTCITHLSIQYGRHKPSTSTSATSSSFDQRVELFDYVPNLKDWMMRASVIVSHAGAGTVLEAIDLGKSLIVVINSKLMDDHQSELAYAMQNLKCCHVIHEQDIETKLLPTIQHVLSCSEQDEKQRPCRVSGVFSNIVVEELKHSQ